MPLAYPQQHKPRNPLYPPPSIHDQERRSNNPSTRNPPAPYYHSYSPRPPSPSIPHPSYPQYSSSRGGPAMQPDPAPLPHWSETNIKRARFDTMCGHCRLPIRTGTRIVYHFQLRRFVHATCAQETASIPNYIPATIHEPAQASHHIPDLLAPGSPLDLLSPSYRQEAVRWVQYHGDCSVIPGIHVEFSSNGLKRYLNYRSRSTKGIAGILCKLKKMGQVCGFILCTSKYQQPSLQYQEIQDHKRKILSGRRDAGLDGDRNEALATGKFAVGFVLSGFRIINVDDYDDLHPIHGEFMAIETMLHSGCLRFGIFNDTNPLREDLHYSVLDSAWVFTTTWRKTRKSNRPYSIRFFCAPDEDFAGMYRSTAPHGSTLISAGTIISWYLHSTGLQDADPKTPLFPRLSTFPDRRYAFQRWLRSVFSAVLPAGSNLPNRIRPHSARAGWATDRARQNVPSHTLQAEGRWNDPRAMRLYVRECLRDVIAHGRPRYINRKEPLP